MMEYDENDALLPEGLTYLQEVYLQRLLNGYFYLQQSTSLYFLEVDVSNGIL